MLKVANVESWGWEAAIRGMRNPHDSWAKSDSILYEIGYLGCDDCPKRWEDCSGLLSTNNGCFQIGANDLDLACRLIKAGPEHAKFLRMIHVQMDITAPLFLWSEIDTYKVSTTRNSCSKMHRIHIKSFELDDFTHEGCNEVKYAMVALNSSIIICEQLRKDFNETKEKKYWRALIELLPESYNMLATWDGSMQTILSILKQRKGHKLEEWEEFRQACFENIPYCKEFYEAYTGD